MLALAALNVGRGRVVGIALALGAVWGCAPSPEPVDPAAAAALELFELAALAERPPQRIKRRFELAGDESLRAELGDALDRVTAVEAPQVTLVQHMPASGRTVVDLTASWPGGGSAEYSVQLEGAGEEWTIVWFQGPGIDWPRRPRSRGDGLSTSTPP